MDKHIRPPPPRCNAFPWTCLHSLRYWEVTEYLHVLSLIEEVIYYAMFPVQVLMCVGTYTVSTKSSIVKLCVQYIMAIVMWWAWGTLRIMVIILVLWLTTCIMIYIRFPLVLE